MKKINNSAYFLLIIFFLLVHTLTAKTDKYRLLLREDPSTTICIGWNQVDGKAPLVYYSKEDHGNSWEKYTNRHMPDRIVNYKGMKNCFARISYLEADTKYYFIIKDENSISKRFWFKTAPDDSSSRLSIIAGGDSRNNRDVRQNANLLVSKLKPHAILFGGDMVRRGTDEEWEDWFDDWQLTIATTGQMFPIIATRGNHERYNEDIFHLFDTPSEDIYYTISFGKDLLKVYTLNTEISIKGNQREWLESDLKKSQHFKWRIAQYHKPIRPHVLRKFEGDETYNAWAPLFFQYRVKLVVECDAHTVKSTWPIRPERTNWRNEGFIRDDQNGTVYVGEGCWGAPTRNANDPKPWTRAYGEFNQFKWIFIDKNKIELRTVKVDNAREVGSVKEENIFTPPSNLSIWEPSSGSVINIYR